jgi:hypothetical protein
LSSSKWKKIYIESSTKSSNGYTYIWAMISNFMAAYTLEFCVHCRTECISSELTISAQSTLGLNTKSLFIAKCFHPVCARSPSAALFAVQVNFPSAWNQTPHYSFTLHAQPQSNFLFFYWSSLFADVMCTWVGKNK